MYLNLFSRTDWRHCIDRDGLLKRAAPNEFSTYGNFRLNDLYLDETNIATSDPLKLGRRATWAANKVGFTFDLVHDLINWFHKNRLERLKRRGHEV